MGAPLTCAVCSSVLLQCFRSVAPVVLVTVTIILREDEKGISKTRSRGFSRSSSLMPILWPATISGASEELPRGVQRVCPDSGSVSSLSVVLEHSTAEPRVPRTPPSFAASAPSTVVMPPTVGSKPLPVTT